MSTARRRQSFFRALPAYFGGKRRFCQLLFSILAEYLPQADWRNSLLLDPFCGGAAVALYAKAQGFRVVASDVAERAVVVARALIANSSVRLRFEDVLDLFVEPEGDYLRIAARHSPAVFAPGQAAWLDQALTRARQGSEPTRSLLLLLIIKLALRCQPMSMLRGTDARVAARGDYDRVSPRRLGHYLKGRDLFSPAGAWSVAQEVNAGVFGGRGKGEKGDALAVIAAIKADVLYLDPPYPGTTGYEREYRVLDEMLGDVPAASAPPYLDDLLAAADRVPLLLLSYGGPSLTLSELTDRVSRHRPVLRALAVPHVHLASIARRDQGDRFEYIILAGH